MSKAVMGVRSMGAGAGCLMEGREGERVPRGAVGPRAVAAGVAALLLAVSPLQAQRAPTTLSLDDALRVAEGSNPTYRQAVNNLGLNASEMRATWFDEILPSANLSLFNTAFTGNRTTRATDNFGNPIERPETDWVYFSDTEQSVTLIWEIQGPSLFHTFERQKLTNRGRVAAEERALTEVQVAVRRAYMEALEQRELMRAEEELVEARRTDLEVAERLFGLAMKTRVDVLNAELAIEQQNLELLQQRAAFQQAKLALRTQLGDDDLVDFSLAEEPLPIFDPSGLDADALVRRALRVNPALREADLATEGARAGLQESRASWWPSLFVQANIGRTARTRNGDALFDVSFDETLDSRFYVGLRFPMFNNYFQNRQAIDRAGVELDNRREAERETRLGVEEAVRSAVLELENQWQSLRLAERSAEIAEEALRLAREEYRIGTRTFEDLRSAFDQEADTRRQVIQARHSFVDALLSLEEAVGAPVRGAGAGGR